MRAEENVPEALSLNPASNSLTTAPSIGLASVRECLDGDGLLLENDLGAGSSCSRQNSGCLSPSRGRAVAILGVVRSGCNIRSRPHRPRLRKKTFERSRGLLVPWQRPLFQARGSSAGCLEKKRAGHPRRQSNSCAWNLRHLIPRRRISTSPHPISSPSR
jgi:hypothetical protein